jgi:hypothetical protein
MITILEVTGSTFEEASNVALHHLIKMWDKKLNNEIIPYTLLINNILFRVWNLDMPIPNGQWLSLSTNKERNPLSYTIKITRS